GDAWAFEALYRAIAPAVAAYLRVQGAGEPEDLTNEVFLRVFRGLGRFTGNDAQFRSWVFSIAHARLVDERRARARRARYTGAAGVGPAPPRAAGNVEDDVLRELGEQRVRELCERLAPDQRDVLLLRVVADLTVEQVARLVGKTTGATKALQR